MEGDTLEQSTIGISCLQTRGYQLVNIRLYSGGGKAKLHEG